MDFNFLLTEDLAVPEVLQLYREAGWWNDHDDPAVIPAMLAGSFRIAAAFAPDGRLIGMARALSDGVSDAYIQDVIVNAAYRKQGIGGRLVMMLAEELRQCGITWIGLIGVPGTENFYRQLGFAPMTGHVPMLWQESE